MKAYINYPEPHITIHNDNCEDYQKRGKSGQRIITINSSNLRQVLGDFLNDKYKFAPDVRWNDMWLSLDLDLKEQNIGIAHVLHVILSNKYSRFNKGSVMIHRCLIEQ